MHVGGANCFLYSKHIAKDIGSTQKYESAKYTDLLLLLHTIDISPLVRVCRSLF